jgi:DHA1 family tetracycline resistance protein-like MFS transporter
MPFRWARANPLGAFKLLRSHRELFGLASTNFLVSLAHAVLPAMGVLYMLYRYGWNERTVGLVMAGVGICMIVVQGGLVGPAVKQLGERKALIVGLVFGVAGFFVYGGAPTGLIFLMGVPLMALWGIAGPAALGIMSRRVGADEQGQLQGANASIQGIANLIGPALFTLSFSLAIRPDLGLQLPGMPFWIAALLMIGAIVIAWKVTRPDAATPEASS